MMAAVYFIGKGIVAATAAVDVGIMGGVLGWSALEGARSLTRDRDHWSDYEQTGRRLTQLKGTGHINELAKCVLLYEPSYKVWNYVGMGSSKSSRELYYSVIALENTKANRKEFYKLFKGYLLGPEDKDHNGKTMYRILKKYIWKYTEYSN